MIGEMYAYASVLASLVLTVYVVRLRQGWIYSLGAVFFGLLAVSEVRMAAGPSYPLVLVGSIAVVFGGMMWRRAWVIGLVTLVMYATVTPAVTQALQGRRVDASSGAAPAVQFSKVGGICLFSLALAAIGARRSWWLVRAIQQVRDVNLRIWDGASNGLVIVDLDLRVVEWNPAMERLTGLARRNVLGTALTECPGFDRSSLHKECLRLAKQGIEIASDAIPADGGVADSPFRGYYSPLRNQEGEIGGVFAMLTAANAQTSQAAFRALHPLEAPAA